MPYRRGPRRGPTARRFATQAIEPLESRTLLAAEFVADLNPYTAASAPQQFVTVGDTAYFLAKSGAGDAFGLYRTDGTSAGTAQVAEGLTNPKGLAAAGGRLYFWASDPIHGMEVWTSDGTAAGTKLLKDTTPGIGSGRPTSPTAPSAEEEFIEFGGRAFFAQGYSTNAGGVWSSDGTAEGTVKLGGTTGFGRAWDFAVLGGHLYYLRNTQSSGLGGLWRTDGTPEGTLLLRGYVNCSEEELHSLTVIGDTLFFAGPASPGSVNTRLWKTDGTAAGTVPVQDPPASTDALKVRDMVNAGGTLYFTAGYGSGVARHVWTSDGTAAGTVPARTGAAAPHSPQRLHALPGGGVVFTASTTAVSGNTGDWELWGSDGTAAGTRLLKDIWPGSERLQSSFGDPRNVEFQRFGSFLYFAANDGVFGRELWRTDGTTEGTTRVADVAPGPRSSGPGGAPPAPPTVANAPRANGFAVVGGKLVFSAAGDPDDYEVWATDGTEPGTARLADLNTTPLGSGPRNMAALDGQLLVTGEFGSTDRGLFRTDGTAAGTILISGVAPALLPFGLATPGNGFGVVGGVAYYAGVAAGAAINTAAAQTFVYRTDGTAAGTVAVSDLRARGGFDLPPNPVVAADGAAYFTALRLPNESGLWRADAADGTPVLLDLGSREDGKPQLSAYARLTPVGELVYFFAGNSAGSTLWRTDGTEAGTVELTTQALVLNHVSVTTAVVGDLLFVTPMPGGMLVTDGTPAGTRALGDTIVGWEVAAFNGAAYFTVTGAHPTGGGSGPAIFRTDGTAAGTHLVKHIAASGPAPLGLSVLGEKLYFWADDGTHGYEPWVSDGTGAGTRMAADVRPGPGGSKPSLPNNFERGPAFGGSGARAYFAADDGTHGVEPWGTDGTTAGTRLEGDLFPGVTGSHPSVPVAAGGDVYFAATDPAHGRELWRVPAPATVAGRYVFYNNSALDGRDPGASAGDDAAIAADKQALLPGHAATAANRTGYSRGINGVMIDLAGLPTGADPTTNDFSFRARRGSGSGWAEAPHPRVIDVRHGAGASGADRVTLVWDDHAPGGRTAHRAVADGWLEITVKATARTGLSSPDTFLFGNLRGDADGGDRGVVDVTDLVRTRAAIGTVSASSPFDYNRDGRVNVLDLVVVREGLFNSLEPVGWTEVAGSSSAASRAAPRLPVRRAAYGIL